MARFRHSQIPNVLSLETPLYELIGAKLAAMGHTVKSVDGGAMGGVQAIMVLPDSTVPSAASGVAVAPGGYYRAGSDFRKDGQAVGW